MRPKINSMYRSETTPSKNCALYIHQETVHVQQFLNSELFANPKNYPECMNQKKYLQKRTYLLIVDLSIQKN